MRFEPPPPLRVLVADDHRVGGRADPAVIQNTLVVGQGAVSAELLAAGAPGLIQIVMDRDR